MPNSVDENEEREQQLDALIAEYYRLEETGKAPDHNEFIAQHPDFAKELTEFFADVLILHGQDRPDPHDPALEPTITAGTSQRKSLAAGSVVRYFGVYEILEELGSGGMGVAYKARHARLRKLVALKMIKAGALASEFEVKMFEAEARAAAKLDHPGIVAVHEVGVHAGQHFYSMDYVTGGSLSKLHRDEPVPAKRTAELVKQLAEAIHYAHGQGIVHRDLKPANILLTADGVPRITDFGLAKRLWAGDDSVALSMTETGQILGTAGYMSPEQAEGKTKLVGPSADIYALGAVLYALLTSRAPFIGESQADTIRQVIEKEPVSPRVLNPSLPRDLETICLKCLNKERHERYGTAQLLAEDLSAFLDGRPIAARPIGYIGRTAKWVRRHRLVSSLLLLTCVSMLLGTVFSVHFGITAGQEAVKADKARTEATQSLAEVELSDYLNRIVLAQTEWQADNIKGCEELLDACPEHLRGWEWNYLKRLCHMGSVMSINLRDGSPPSSPGEFFGPADLSPFLAYSKDGSRLFAAAPGSLDARDAETGRILQSLPLDHGPLAYDPTHNVILVGKRLVDGTSFDETLTLQVIDTGGLESRATFSADGSLVAIGGTSVIVLSSQTGAALYELPVTDGGQIHSLAFSPSGKYLAIGRRDVLQVWDLGTQTVAFSEPFGGQYVTFDATGNWLIAGTVVSFDFDPAFHPDVRIWSVPGFQLARSFATDGRGGPLRQRIVGNREYVRAIAGTHQIAVCPFTQQLGVLSWDTSLRLVNLDVVIKLEETPRNLAYDTALPEIDSRPEVVALRGGLKAQPLMLAFDPLGKRVATVDWLGMLRTWDISSPQEAREYGDRTTAETDWPSVQIGDSTVAMPIKAPGDEIRIIDLIDGTSINMLCSRGKTVLSEDGRLLATITDDRLHVRSVSDQEDVLLVDDVSPIHCKFSLDPKGRRLALQSNGHIRVWDITSSNQLCDITIASHGLPSDQTGTWCVAFDPAGETIAACRLNDETCTVGVWDVASARLIAKVSVARCRNVFLSEDRLIAVSHDRLTCWPLSDEEQPSAIPVEVDSVKPAWVYQIPIDFENLAANIVSMSIDFTRIAVLTDSGTVTILDGDTGMVVGERSQRDLMPFRLSPDGSRLLGYKSDGQLYLHHIDSHRDVLNLSVLGLSVSEMTSDGNKIVGVLMDGIVRVLDGTPWDE